MYPRDDSLKNRSYEEIIDELALYLVPPGQGVFAVSSGKAELLDATRRYLGCSWKSDRPWRDHLVKVSTQQRAILAIPSDAGAGIVRGAARGPEAIRARLGAAPAFDLGDVFTIPHLIDDPMLSTEQIERCQDALFPQVSMSLRRSLPVSPLSMASRCMTLLDAVAPHMKILMLGGDHTVTWPMIAHHLSGGPEANLDFGIVHFDAHTDLSHERLGVKYCFATWAHHANQMLGGEQRLVQIGIRASAHPRSHWEQRQDVRQIWADEARAMSPEQLAQSVVSHLKSRNVRRIYVSNDLDGTDSYWAAACGTPEPAGLSPSAVLAVIHALIGRFEVVGADVVELAPGLSLDQVLADRSIQLATDYAQASLKLFESPPGLE